VPLCQTLRIVLIAGKGFIATITDYPYASTYGDELKPELSIGRIIGNNPDALRKPIETSLNVLLGVSGYGFDGVSRRGFRRTLV